MHASLVSLIHDEMEIHGDQIKEIEDAEFKLSEPVGWIVSFRL
jgi:hypothetical protein